MSNMELEIRNFLKNTPPSKHLDYIINSGDNFCKECGKLKNHSGNKYTFFTSSLSRALLDLNAQYSKKTGYKPPIVKVFCQHCDRRIY